MFRVRSSLAQDFEQTLFCPLHQIATPAASAVMNSQPYRWPPTVPAIRRNSRAVTHEPLRQSIAASRTSQKL